MLRPPLPWVEAMRECVGVGDYIKFSNLLGQERHGLILAGGDNNQVRVLMLRRVTTETFERYSFTPITATAYPMAYTSRMVELMSVGEEIYLPRHSIIDIIFVLPIQEVESGYLSMAGSHSMFFQRYGMLNDAIAPCPESVYFSSYLVEPLSVRLFQSLNMLATHIKRAMYHGPMSSISFKTFRLPFSIESFLFLRFKLSDAFHDYFERKEKTIIYYNTLEMEARTNTVKKNYININTAESLQLLREILGDGIGLGLAKERPTKRNPWGVCSINNILTSLEVPDDTSAEVTNTMDGVYLMYTEEKRLLTCNVRFSKVNVIRVEDVTSRLPDARVEEAETGAYVNAWFQLNGALHEVVNIAGAVARSKPVGSVGTANEIVLSLALVNNLVRTFGS
jgi:hypothetical protein